MPPVAALAADQHGGVDIGDVVGQSQHLAAEGMADQAERRAGTEPRQMIDHRGLIDGAPLFHGRRGGCLGFADAAIIVGQHGEAAHREMTGERAVELAGDAGAAVQQDRHAVGRRRLEQGRGELHAVSRRQHQVHARSIGAVAWCCKRKRRRPT